MSSIPFDSGKARTAERHFREAFERMKTGKLVRLPKGTKVTQNNVAKEAGTVSSALRRSRFPDLVAEIQAWIELQQSSASQQSSRGRLLAQRGRNRDLRERIVRLEAQRDEALGKLVSVEARILELVIENERLQSEQPKSNIVLLKASATSPRREK